METILRQWNDNGDWLQFPEYVGDDSKISVEYNRNELEIPTLFEFDRHDIIQLKNWCENVLGQMKEKSP